jgi:peptidoglycan hydrolase CwlO-like protein
LNGGIAMNFDATVMVAIIGTIGTILVANMNNRNSEIKLLLEQYQGEMTSLRNEIKEERKEKEELKAEITCLRQEIAKYRSLIEVLNK